MPAADIHEAELLCIKMANALSSKPHAGVAAAKLLNMLRTGDDGRGLCQIQPSHPASHHQMMFMWLSINAC